ncbi:hypothetical protein CVT24_010282 [Panaeolus cyanescens]|uniref:Uncharacterized protein n=1 Tax=Panaeolus cyanescens TaxID=181874 RepID=A0A409W8Z2_9AGAR|nr:hypothetical protein CVT24_010282 [Panaeolus cyanescens]
MRLTFSTHILFNVFLALWCIDLVHAEFSFDLSKIDCESRDFKTLKKVEKEINRQLEETDKLLNCWEKGEKETQRKLEPFLGSFESRSLKELRSGHRNIAKARLIVESIGDKDGFKHIIVQSQKKHTISVKCDVYNSDDIPSKVRAVMRGIVRFKVAPEKRVDMFVFDKCKKELSRIKVPPKRGTLGDDKALILAKWEADLVLLGKHYPEQLIWSKDFWVMLFELAASGFKPRDIPGQKSIYHKGFPWISKPSQCSSSKGASDCQSSKPQLPKGDDPDPDCRSCASGKDSDMDGGSDGQSNDRASD